MQKLTAAQTLKSSILVLEQRQIAEGKLLRDQFTVTFESLKPVNVLRKVINDLTHPSDLKDDVLQTATSLISGYLSRKLLVRSSKNPILRLAGLFVQYGVTSFVAMNSSAIKSMGLRFINKLADSSREKKSKFGFD